MKIKSFDLKKNVLIIAEIGNNHEGSYALAEELIGKAKEAGVDAVKFQTFKTELFVSRREKDRFARLKSFELSYSSFEKLHAIAKRADLLFISTPLDLESASFLEKLVDAYKIASGDNNFYPLLDRVANTGLPLIISGGLATHSQLKKSVSYIKEIWKRCGIDQSLSLLHCVSSYPVPVNECNLSSITYLIENFHNTIIGHSDHSIGVDASMIAVALGARIIEKHFTIDKNYSNFRDHQLSSDPAEMQLLVQKIRKIDKMMGTKEKDLQPSEKNNLETTRRSIVATRDIKQGEIIKWNDISWIRPGLGLTPGEEELVVGKRLKENIFEGDLLTTNILF